MDWATTFICVQCEGPMLYAHFWPDGRVELSAPGQRLGTYNRLRDPLYRDQRATGIPIERTDPGDRPPVVTKRGSVVVSCGRCGSRRRYPRIGGERFERAARDAARIGAERVVVTSRGELVPDVPLHHRPRRSLPQ